MTTRAFIQARMSSRRFPGKVLAPFRGEPMIVHTVRAVADALGPDAITVVTSDDATDDPLAAFLATRGVACFRGPLDDVFQRFRLAAAALPCEWILRVSADSPLLDPTIVRQVIRAARPDLDLVTTTFPRTFPKGQNAELIRTSALLSIDAKILDTEEREHVTPYLYRHADAFRILNITSSSAADQESCAVDTLDDLRRLEPVRVGQA